MKKSIKGFKSGALGIFLVLSCIFSTLSASNNYFFYVQLANKNNSPYSLAQPQAYLSERAIARRTAFGLACDSTDLPVNPSYIQQIEQTGAHVHCRSRWLNAVTVTVSDSSLMSQIRALPFVKRTEYTGLQASMSQSAQRTAKTKTDYNYGLAEIQTNQLNGKYLHNQGFKGKNIHIAVLDAGFNNVDINPCFDSLRLQGRLLGTKDIIQPSANIYAEDSHGAMVLSTMAGNLPGQFLGTAPDASYWLIRTEYAPTEYKVETDFWCSGIEFADSAGVDIVNSSLGYFTFDDASMNFRYADMNGKIARSSLAANLASKKGIIVVASAGNEGNDSWHYIGSPADADGIITVGAVMADSTSSNFSSYGPSADNRVKPELCARGTYSGVVGTSGSTGYANGTSFSSPILAGMMGCYLQMAKKIKSPLSINTLLKPVFESAHRYQSPTDQQGYGLPNFEMAAHNLGYFSGMNQIKTGENFGYSYDSGSRSLFVWAYDQAHSGSEIIRLYSITGKMIHQDILTNNSIKISLDNLSNGIYAVQITGRGKSETKKIRVF